MAVVFRDHALKIFAVSEIYILSGVPLNFGKGKSESLIRWRGENVLIAKRRRLAGVDDGIVIVKCEPKIGDPFELRMVYKYKHICSMVRALRLDWDHPPIPRGEGRS